MKLYLSGYAADGAGGYHAQVLRIEGRDPIRITVDGPVSDESVQPLARELARVANAHEELMGAVVALGVGIDRGMTALRRIELLALAKRALSIARGEACS